jgi:hypothetical protein
MSRSHTSIQAQSRHAMRAPTHQQAPVIVNATTDWVEVDRRRNPGLFDQQGTGQPPYFPSMNLPDEISDQQYLFFPHEPLYALRAASADVHKGQRFALAASASTESVRVPLLPTLNGIDADNYEDMCRRIVPFGVCDAENRDNGQSDVNAQVGGSITVTNNSGHPIATGAYGRFYPPRNTEQGKFPSNAVVNKSIMSGDPGNSTIKLAGRVPLVFEEYNPHEINFYDPANLARAIVGAAAANGIPEVKGLPLVVGAGSIDLLEPAPTSAGIKAQQYLSLLASAATLALFIGNGANPDAAAVAAARLRITDQFTPANLARVLANVHLQTPLQESIQRLAQLKMDIERFVCFRVLFGAKSGDDMDILLGNYCM